jgi:hypothetical protein
MIANRVTKIVQTGGGTAVLVLFLAASVHAQNVCIGSSDPLSKLTINGNFAVGANYNIAAPANGALIEGVTGIGTTSPDSANSFLTAVRSIGLKGVTFTPDIYSLSDSISSEKPDVYTIRLKKAHGLKDGETVRLITPNKNQEVNVVAHVVNEKAFTVETKEPLGDKVFVYGKQCLDLKAVDYDAISMLNVSATQELAKKVETLE